MGGLVLLIGRVVFSFFFIYSGFNHLTKLSMYSQYAAGSGVPAPTLLTALSGLMLLAAGRGAGCAKAASGERMARHADADWGWGWGSRPLRGARWSRSR